MMDTAVSAELDKSSYTRFTAVEITLPTYSIRLLDGAGICSFVASGGPQTFKGSDPIFGTLSNTSSVSDSIASNSPRIDVYLLPPSAEAIGYLSSPQAQGSKVKVWEGVINITTGLVIGAPILLWSGRLDTPEITASQGSRLIRLDTVGALERLFVNSLTETLNSTWAKYMFGPAQTGLDGNVAAISEPPWGIEGQRSLSGNYAVVSPVYGGFGGSPGVNGRFTSDYLNDFAL